MESVDISGAEGILTAKEGLVTIAWSDTERLFVLLSECGEEETIRIA